MTAAALQADVELLASDAYLGRGTGEAGAGLAAAYIESAFAQVGLQPLPGHDSLQVPYTLYRENWDGEATKLSITAGDTPVVSTLGDSWRPFPFSDAGAHQGGVVFAGYGITAETLDWDDYAGLDVTGKWVLVLRHDPGENDEASPWADDNRHSLFSTKARNAVDHGAAGMILVTDPLHHEDADDMRASGGLRLQVPVAAEPAKKTDEPERTFLAIHIDRATAGAMVAGTGKSLLQLQNALNNGEDVRGPLSDVSAQLALTELDTHEEVEPTNVIGFIQGTDPVLKDEWVVVGGHYDHLGAFHGEGDTVYNGADDNASGTSGVLALARAFAQGEAPKRSMVFAAFSGEENGLLGSSALFRDEVLDPRQLTFMLNLDMIGRTDAGELEVVGDGFASGIHAAVESANVDIDLALAFGGTDYSGNSDHHPFYENDVPFLFFFSGLHDDYHQLSDHADKLDYPRMEKIVRLGHGILDQVASGAVSPQFIHHISWLGIQVQLMDVDGKLRAKITSIDDDSRATEAGLQLDDQIYGFADTPMKKATDVGPHFRDLKPGAKTRLTVDRPDTRITVEIERAKTGYLGVWPTGPTDEFRQEHGLGEREGVLLRDVMKDTPAEAAGLKADDCLIRINGVPVGLGTLSKVLTRIGADDTVPVTVIRHGKRQDMTITLGERPEQR
jgi:hypothetical protein